MNASLLHRLDIHLKTREDVICVASTKFQSQNRTAVEMKAEGFGGKDLKTASQPALRGIASLLLRAFGGEGESVCDPMLSGPEKSIAAAAVNALRITQKPGESNWAARIFGFDSKKTRGEKLPYFETTDGSHTGHNQLRLSSWWKEVDVQFHLDERRLDRSEFLLLAHDLDPIEITTIEIQLWKKGAASIPGDTPKWRSLAEPGVLPAEIGDAVRIRVEANRPVHFGLIWAGRNPTFMVPLDPENVGDWPEPAARRLQLVERRAEIDLPENLFSVYPGLGTPSINDIHGAESFIVLAHPVPFDLGVIRKAVAQLTDPVPNPTNVPLVRSDARRQRSAETKKDRGGTIPLPDPTIAVHSRWLDRLNPHTACAAIVSFQTQNHQSH